MKKDISFLLLIVMITLAIVPMISAQTLVSPVTNGNYTGTVLISVSTPDNGANNMTNVTCYYNQSGGAATTFLTQILNTSAGQSSFTSSPSISSLTDAMTYNVSCSVYNQTGATSTLNSTLSAGSITFDSTIPVCSVSLAYPSISYMGVQTITWGVTDALSLVSGSETITSPSGANNQAYSVTGASTTTISGTQTDESGNWNASIVGTDRSGNTCSASQIFSSYVPGGKQTTTTTSTTGTTPVNTQTILIIGGIALLAYFLTKKK